MSHPDLLPSPTLFSVSWTSIAQFPAPVCVGWLPWPVTSGSVRDFFFFSGKKNEGRFLIAQRMVPGEGDCVRD